ncbi:hypothetical protein FNF27_05838 [Cafeteria roenbergensis]|uniref:DNA polymerase n=1 Tax=Cafeteria roenbergensis TaxID=33653 RepID=A0A5A8E5W5_CAFRO|nr:hypothetical protein FNF27_05838 [Cafeteria roenbergensis]
MDQAGRAKVAKTAQSKALQQLAAARRGSGRARLLDVEEEDDAVFEEVTDEQYEKLVRKRQREDFVVDDDGFGYADDGEERYGDEAGDGEASGEDDGSVGSDGDDDEGAGAGRAKRARLARQRKLASRRGAAAAGGGIRSLFGRMAGDGGDGRRPADHARQGGATAAKPPSDSSGATAAPSGGAGLEDMLKQVDSDDDDDDDDDVAAAAPSGAAATGTLASSSLGANPLLAGAPASSGFTVAAIRASGKGAAVGSLLASGVGTRMAPSKRAALARAAARVAPSKLAAASAAAGSGAAAGEMPALPSQGGGGGDTGGWWAADSAGVAATAAAAAAASAAAGPSGDDAAASLAPLPDDLPTVRARFPGASEDEDCLHVFWLDAYEDQRRNPGKLFLFGKVRVGETGRMASCCVTVTGLERCAFVLPRERDAVTGEPVSHMDVYNEVRDAMRSVLPPGKGVFAVKKVTRSYAFDQTDVPRGEHDYLKLVYPARFPALPQSVTRDGRSYRRIFGCGNPPLETFLLKRGIKGPCWLEIRGAKAPRASVSWCKYEVEIGNPKHINPLGASSPSLAAARLDRVPPSPPLSVLSLSLKTVVDPRSQAHEVVMASGLFHPAINVDGPTALSGSDVQHFTAVGPPTTASLPVDLADVIKSNAKYSGGALVSHANERSLLSFLLARIASLDPDVIMGHNITGFDMDVLLHRMSKHKIGHWSRIGRLRRHEMPRSKSGVHGRDTFLGVTVAGRLVCDTYRAAQELVRQTSYGLTALSKDLLEETRTGVDPVDVPRYYGTGQDTLWLARHTENDAWLALRLAGHLQVLPLTKQLTNLAGNLWSRSLQGARAERIEFLLLHEFHRLKYVVPDKFDEQRKLMADGGGARRSGGTGRKKAAYAGGLVLEPKVGLYDKFVLLLDFNSLYPSIIQEFNICFTTVEHMPSSASGGAKSSSSSSSTAAAAASSGAMGELAEEDEEEEDDGHDDLPPLPSPSLPDGVLPKVIRMLVDRRRVVKGLLKQETDQLKKQQLDIKQKALKILANSMYGCLGFANSRFYAKPLAALVTTQGREILQDTVDLAQEALGLEVIYGDTDSIMVYTGSTNVEVVMGLAQKVIKEVNKKYKRLEIDVDGVYARMLLLKKKKYAALMIDEMPRDGKPATFKKEMKGLDIVRRDWCPLAKKTGEAVLDIVLGGSEKDDAVASIFATLEQVGAAVREGKVPMEEFVITKGLNKAPKDYPDRKGQAHLQVAMRMLAAGKTVNVGDHIPFVITDGEEPGAGGGAAAAVAGSADSSSSSSSAAAAAAAGGTPTKAPAAVASGGTGKGKKQAADRARHPAEVVRFGLAVDTDWYMTNQILPVVSRLCAPIDGTSPKQLAEALGLDASRFAGAFAAAGAVADLFGDDKEYVPKSVLSDEERFRHARHLVGRCGRCGKAARIEGALHSDAALLSNAETACGLMCPAAGCGGLLSACAGDTATGCSPASAWTAAIATAGAAVPLEESRVPGLPAAPLPAPRGSPLTQSELDECRTSLITAVALAARGTAAAYGQGWHVCDEGTCRMRTRNVSTARGDGCPRPACRGKLWPEMPAAVVHNQLEFLATAFDPARAEERAKTALAEDGTSKDAAMRLAAMHAMDDALKGTLLSTSQQASQVLSGCAYHFVAPAAVFGYVGKLQRRQAAKRRRAAGYDEVEDSVVVEQF